LSQPHEFIWLHILCKSTTRDMDDDPLFWILKLDEHERSLVAHLLLVRVVHPTNPPLRDVGNLPHVLPIQDSLPFTTDPNGGEDVLPKGIVVPCLGRFIHDVLSEVGRHVLFLLLLLKMSEESVMGESVPIVIPVGLGGPAKNFVELHKDTWLSVRIAKVGLD